MALFNWADPVTCGEDPPEVCDPLITKEEVFALRATNPEGKCEVELIAEQHPSIPVILSDVLTVGRSGSSTSPIPLTKVQEYTGIGPVPTLAFRNLAGDLSLWNPEVTCDDKKVVVTNGQFCVKDDVNNNVFEESCIGSYDDVQYIAGAVLFTDCNDVTRVKLVFFDKSELPAFS